MVTAMTLLIAYFKVLYPIALAALIFSMQPSVIPLGLTPFWFFITIFILIGVMCVIYWSMKQWPSWQNEIAAWIKIRQHLEEEPRGLEGSYRQFIPSLFRRRASGDEESLDTRLLPQHHQPSYLPISRDSYCRDTQYGHQHQVTESVPKLSQHNPDSASPLSVKIRTRDHLKSPSSTSRPESSYSQRDLSAELNEKTDWREDGSSSGSWDVDSGDISEEGQTFEERNSTVGLLLSPMKRRLVEDIMKEFWDIFNRGDNGNR